MPPLATTRRSLPHRRGGRACALAAAFGLGFGVAACGQGAPAPTGAGELQLGRNIYSTSCSGCHTLAPNPRVSPQGGSLSGYRMTVAQIASFTRVMPLRRPLDERQVQAVARYLAQVQAQTRRGRAVR